MTSGLIPAEQPPSPPPPEGGDPFRYGWRFVKELRPDGGTDLVQVPLTLEDVLHPQEGDQIPERFLQAIERRYLANVFNARLAQLPGGLVVEDQLVDWNVPGQRNTAPDVALFREVANPPPLQSGTLRLAEAGGRCVLAIELVSPDTRENDVTHKFREYYQARVPLYVIVDQAGEEQPRHLLPYRHTRSNYRPIPLDQDGRVLVGELGLKLGLRDEQIFCYDALTGAEVGDYTQIVGELEREKQAHQAAEEACQAAEERTQAEIAARQAAEQARQTAEEHSRAESTARQAAEQRAQELEAELRRLRGNPPTP